MYADALYHFHAILFYTEAETTDYPDFFIVVDVAEDTIVALAVYMLLA